MPNYTVELRQIDNVFDFDYPFYEEQFKCEFEEKFIKHYYFDEIGFETISRFKQRLEAKLLKKMPYWTQIYQTELESQGISWLLNKDLKETFIRTVDTEDKINGISDSTGSDSSNSKNTNESNTTSTGKSSTDNTGNSTSNSKQSNIADGVASVSLESGYLTGIQQDLGTSEGNSTTNDQNESTGILNSLNEASSIRKNNIKNTEDRNGKLLEKTELISQGNIGTTSSAELLIKWREILINLDEIIIDECQDLFLGIF